MPKLNGVDAARQIVQDVPDTKPIILTAHPEEPYVLEALRAGVRGFVVKTQAVEELVQAIHDVLQGEVYLSAGVSRAVVEAFLAGVERLPDRITARERQILQLVAEGKTTKEIAGLLDVSAKTVESHRTRIMKKLDIHDTAGLVRYAIRKGLVQP